MKIKVGIVGYGNLGKAIEQELLKNSHFKLVAIFSRRNIVSTFKTNIVPYEDFKTYKNKIDIMFLCGGSQSDIEEQAPEISELFDTINSYDTHSKIYNLKSTLNKITQKNDKRAIISAGWDPGLFSIIRALFYSITDTKPSTFWGKGISLGHSDAIRKIPGVEDAIQFTIPNKTALNMAKTGEMPESENRHIRDCYVVAEKNHNNIERKIKNIPNYFLGQPTKVTFVSRDTLNKLRKNMSHKGIIISKLAPSDKSSAYMELSVKMKSNPNFTAKIMISYASAIIRLKSENKTGAFLPYDIPISYLFANDNKDNLLSSLC